FILVYFLYPETKGVPLEEMDAVFGEDAREEAEDNASTVVEDITERTSLLSNGSQASHQAINTGTRRRRPHKSWLSRMFS
ncbi:hypothetical protein V5O48_019429, partial [Marasmius crinis-equi]